MQRRRRRRRRRWIMDTGVVSKVAQTIRPEWSLSTSSYIFSRGRLGTISPNGWDVAGQWVRSISSRGEMYRNKVSLLFAWKNENISYLYFLDSSSGCNFGNFFHDFGPLFIDANGQITNNPAIW